MYLGLLCAGPLCAGHYVLSRYVLGLYAWDRTSGGRRSLCGGLLVHVDGGLHRATVYCAKDRALIARLASEE
jgi:hypothetical protein